MPEYLWPCSASGVSDTFQDHKNRTPPSVNPGTDITAGYGSNVWATRRGYVSGIGWSNSGSGGRYIQISNDNGSRSQYLHLSRIDVVLGQTVDQGEHIALSGASGFGSDWGYGPHLHKSLMIGGSNVDFQNYSSPDPSWAGGNFTPIPQEDELSAAEVDAINANTNAKYAATLVVLNDMKAWTMNAYNASLTPVYFRPDGLAAAIDKEEGIGHVFANGDELAVWRRKRWASNDAIPVSAADMDQMLAEALQSAKDQAAEVAAAKKTLAEEVSK